MNNQNTVGNKASRKQWSLGNLDIPERLHEKAVKKNQFGQFTNNFLRWTRQISLGPIIKIHT